MKRYARDLLRATVDVARGVPEAERAAVADAGLELLRKHGCSKEIRLFRSLFRAEWLRQENIVFATLSTPDGKAGMPSQDLASMLEKHFGKKVQIEETACKKLIGGALLAVGDERYDYSLKNALDQFETHVESAFPILSLPRFS